ncbi:G-alpha-domain-containing protein [Amylocystis lapponica]|nr:G-alpha-domain-containing protein [Amylocystis lapponica]
MPNIWPPPLPTRETELEKALRLEEEREAKKISDEIDRAIERERQELRRNCMQEKILLLGQAESGKSTMLKNFQLNFAPAAFHAETEAWRAVIHLNLVHSVIFILDLLQGGTSHGEPDPKTSDPKDDHRLLRMRLTPLRQVEMILEKCLEVSSYDRSPSTDSDSSWDTGKASEISVRGGSGWKALVQSRKERHTRFSGQHELDNARQILEACRDDMVSLWEDPSIQEILREHGVALQEQPGFFLDQIQRIATVAYNPTPEDILRARLRTIGVEEHHVELETVPSEKVREWIFYDVGGHRGQRAAWAPFFEDVNAMIFLCSIAAFDQNLSEDHTVNRLVDSMKLWKTICSSSLLKNTTFILLLNKFDILKTKLESGIQFSDWFDSYTDSNESENVTSYLKGVFKGFHKECSSASRKRQLHVHATCAVDTTMMSIVLGSIRDVILFNTLQETNLI